MKTGKDSSQCLIKWVELKSSARLKAYTHNLKHSTVSPSMLLHGMVKGINIELSP